MQKIYLLLRNNKQSGPFTREELLQQGLKKHDLIWAEGRSAGWRSPEEIAELKTGAEPAFTNTVTGPPVTEKPAAAAPAIGQKHIYISLPSGMPPRHETAAATTPIPAAVNEEEKQESFEDRVLRMQQRVAAYNSRSTAPENNEEPQTKKEEPQTKYARSLDDIKEEYAGWLHRQKKRKARLPVKPMLTAAAALLAIVLVSIFILRKDEAATPSTSINEPAIQVAALPVSSGIAVNEESTAASEKAGSRQPVVKKQAAVLKKTVAAKSTKGSNYNTKKSNPTTPVLVTKEPVSEPPAVPLSRLIRIFGNDVKKQKKGIDDFQLTVQNNSRQTLKVVAVDVFYYGSNGRQLQKKTLYFSNLGAHRSLSLAAPGHKKATAVAYKLGLVSSDQGLYYAKQ